MLAASAEPPNHRAPSTRPRTAPRPSNWRGVDAGLREAKAAFRAGRRSECEAILREVLEFAPSEARAWAWLGKTLEADARIEEAQACYDRARALLARSGAKGARRPEPTPPASVPLAKLLWRQGEHEAARAMLGVLLLRDPEDARLLELKDAWGLEG